MLESVLRLVLDCNDNGVFDNSFSLYSELSFVARLRRMTLPLTGVGYFQYIASIW